MSWMQKLCQTYDDCLPLVGDMSGDTAVPLLPVAHTTQKAHLELIISQDGQFLRAHVLTEKKESDTVIPCSEKSQVRSGIHPKNYPLFDKLQYLAGDFARYGGGKSEFFYKEYIDDLRAWCNSPHAHMRVRSALRYFERGTLIADLIAAGILPTGQDGMPLHKWKEEMGEKRGIFQAGSVLSDAMDAFVRFDVEIPGGGEPLLWNDPTVWDSYVAYYASQQGEKDLCYVTGLEMPCSEMSPAKIRGSGDKAKLISSNDISGFTYRGRFTEPSQAVRIGYDTTQKAHNVLKWLIARQGYHCGDLCYVAWGTHGEQLPVCHRDTMGLAMQTEKDFSVNELDEMYISTALPDVETVYAKKLDALLAGYGKRLDDRAEIVVMGLDSATTGRLSIVCYEELSGSELLRRVRRWHTSCAWPLRYLKRSETAPAGSVFVGAPSPEDIVVAAYGKNVSDKLRKAAVRRIMPCVLESMRFPADIMRCAVRRASNPAAMDDLEYVKTLCIACALVRKYHFDNGRNYSMALDLNNKERSYLFGRVLAYCHYIESYLLDESESSRPTNAMRLKPYYWRRPKTTLGMLEDKLSPYLRRLDSRSGDLAGFYKGKVREMYGVISELDGNNCEKMTDAPLDETYLLGFASQLNEFYKKKGE
jgi:CRISPR-associated protein Csd1